MTMLSWPERLHPGGYRQRPVWRACLGAIGRRAVDRVATHGRDALGRPRRPTDAVSIRVIRRLSTRDYEVADVMPTRLALTSQSLAVTSASYAALLAVFGFLLAKNWPVTPATLGEDAK